MNTTRTDAINLMEALGRINKETADFWRENKAYVPFDRVFEDSEKGPLRFARGQGLAVLKNFPGMEGSLGRPVKNVFDSYAKRLGSMIEDAMKNNASVKLLQTMADAGFAKELLNPNQATNKNLVVPRLFVDGKPVYFEVQNQYDMLAFQQAPEITNFLVKGLGAFTRALRISITATPMFAVKQVVERGFGVRDVAARLGTSPHSLYAWINKYGIPAEQRLVQDDQTAKLKRLEAELRRVTEERDILKKAAAYFAKESG
jgi:transposase